MKNEVLLSMTLMAMLSASLRGQAIPADLIDKGKQAGSVGGAVAAKSVVPLARAERPRNNQLRAEKSESPRAYINDFRVNNENYYSAFPQTQADLACSRWPMTGWVVWTDGRSPNNDIYLQRFDSLMNKAGANIKVNDDTMQYLQGRPDIDCDSVGNVVVVWYDDRWPNGWGQRFDKNGNRLGGNFKLQEDTVNLGIYSAAVAMVGSQGFVTVSNGDHSAFPERVIMAQHFDGNGNYGSHYYVDITNSSKGCVACGWGGNRLVYAWFDYRDGSWSVYARRYDLSGVPLGPSFRVSEPAAVISVSEVYDSKPALAVGDTGQFCIAWNDYRNGNSDIYAQRYDGNGVPQGANFKVNQDAGSYYQGHPQAYYVKDGIYQRFLLITFSDFSSYPQIYGSMYNASGGLIFSSPFVPADGYPKGTHRIEFSYRPATSNYVGPIAWDVDFLNYRDVYTKNVYSSSHAIKCHNDSLGAGQYNPGVASDSSGRWLVLWNDSRRPDKGPLVMARGYNADGTPATPEVLVSDTLKNIFTMYPGLAINPAGDYIVAWNENNSKITGAWGRIGGAPMSPNLRLSADTLQYKASLSQAIDTAGNFVLGWLDARNANYFDLYGRGFLAGAVPVTAMDVMVNLPGTAVIGYQPRVLSLGAMRFAFIYVMNESGQYAIYCRLAQLTATAINFLGDPFRISDNPAGVTLQYCGAAAGPDGSFLVGWYDYGLYNLKARWFDRDGNAQGASFAVSDDFSYPQYINLAIDSAGRTAFVWQQWVSGDGGDIYARLYHSNRTAYTDPFRVNSDPTAYYQGKPAVTAARGKFYFAWEDGRYDTCGTDIFAKGYTWEELGVASGQVAELKVPGLRLLPNAPNPFSQSTNIKFQIPKSGNVSLKVYNVAGQCVKTLVSEFRAAGSYEVRWDGRDEQGRKAANGVYLYRLATDETAAAGRMTVVR